MKNKTLTLLLTATLSLTAHLACAEDGITITEEMNGPIKTQTIQTQDRYGIIEEQRVQAMHSQIHYVPAGGGDGYTLVGSSDVEGSVKSAHSDSDEMMIPSWKVFSW